MIFADLFVGSDHRKSDWKAFDGTYEVDHLAVLGTSSLVSIKKKKKVFLVIKLCLISVIFSTTMNSCSNVL